MWLPTPDELMFRLFDLAAISADDLVYDLGAGDGRVAIAAARRHGAQAIGIEYDGQLASSVPGWPTESGSFKAIFSRRTFRRRRC
jgi:predicted RNA methylase